MQCIVLVGFWGIYKDPPLEKNVWMNSNFVRFHEIYLNFLFRLVIQKESKN